MNNMHLCSFIANQKYSFELLSKISILYLKITFYQLHENYIIEKDLVHTYPQHWCTCPESPNFPNFETVVEISVHYEFPQDSYPFSLMLQKNCTCGSPVQIDAFSVRHITWYCCTSLRVTRVQTLWSERFRVGMSSL